MSLDYPLFQSKVDVHSEQFAANVESMQPLLERLRTQQQLAANEGSERTIARHRKLGKLMPRERVELLLDEDSPFLEICPLAGIEQDGYAPGSTTFAGIGLVCGVECVITSNRYTIKGGTIDEASLRRSGRAAEIAHENNLPCIMLVESGGANLTQQFKIFHTGGGSFYNITRQSAKKLPQVSVVFGSSTAGGAYTPGMSDYVVMVKKQAKVYLGGPPLVKMATGEITDHESLGGAEMHNAVSGVSDYLAQDELSALRITREIMASIRDTLPPRGRLPKTHLLASPASLEPVLDVEELLGICGADIRRPYDAREVIARIVDQSRFNEFKANYGQTMVCVFARIHGIDVGILANNGILFSDSSLKATQFIQLCNQKNTPLVFLQNINGFMVGRQYEEGGIIKDGAKLINAVSNSTVPAITITMGASYGAGNYAMCGRAYHPRFLFSWPQAKISVMGPDQLSGVLDMVMREAARKRGQTVDEEAAAARVDMFKSQVTEQSDAFYISSRCLDDGVIDPRDTRNTIGFCLSVCFGEPIKGTTSWGVFRM